MAAFDSAVFLNDSRESAPVSPQFLEEMNEYYTAVPKDLIRTYLVCTLLDDTTLIHDKNGVHLVQDVEGMGDQNSSTGSKGSAQEAVIKNVPSNVRINCR
jgi:hypothetical protein